MPTPSAAAALRTGLLCARSDRSWWSTPAGRTLLEQTAHTLRPLALRLGMDEADALSHAFEVWSRLPEQVLADESTDLWAYTRAAVRRALNREDEAARKVTSTAGSRRSDTRDMGRLVSLDGIDIGYDPADTDDEPAVHDPRRVRALAALTSVLVLAGLSPAERDIAIDTLGDIAATAPSPRARIDRAGAAHALFADRFTPAQWTSLAETVLGTAAGKPGILALAAAGHPAPATEPHLSVRLTPLLAAAA